MEDDRAPVAGEWLSSPVDRKLGREMLSAIPPGAWRAAQELAAGAIRSWGSDARGMPASYGGAADGMLTSEQTQYLISHEAFRAHVMHRATEGPHHDFTNLAYATRLAVEEPSRRQQVREQLIDLVWHEYGHSDLDQRYLHGYFEHAIEDRQLTGERAFFASESDLIVGLIDLDAQPSEPERFDGVNGDAKKYDGKLVGVDLAPLRAKLEDTVEHLRSTLGEEQWAAGMNPEIPETKVLDNPYMYTDYRTHATHAAFETQAPTMGETARD